MSMNSVRLALLAASFSLCPLHSSLAKDGKPLFTKAGPIKVHARQLNSFEKGRNRIARYGELEWRGGLVLTSVSKNFGGWSGITFQPGTNKFLAVSDAGTWMSGELTYDGNRPKGIRKARLGPIKALNGKPLRRNVDRDAEAVTLISGTLSNGVALVSFERNDRIGRFPIRKGMLGAPVHYTRRPPGVGRFGNKGIEAVTLLRGGRYRGAMVSFAEEPVRGKGLHSGWIWRKGKAQRFRVAGLGDYAITDAASLKDGTILLLERRFRWTDGVRMRLRRIEHSSLRPKSVVKGRVLLKADLSNEIDNMEGLAIRELPSGEVRLTMISDNNFNSLLQRTVLLEFAIPAPKKAKSAKR